MCEYPEFSNDMWENESFKTMKIKMLTDTAKLPTKAHAEDACYDIYADLGGLNLNTDDVLTIPPHTTVKIPTGFATEIPHGYWAAVFARSGLATKRYLRPAQGVPVIDEPYRGEWFIPLHNDSDVMQTISHGERICQFMLLPYFNVEFNVVEDLSETDRGETGFGDSGRL